MITTNELKARLMASTFFGGLSDIEFSKIIASSAVVNFSAGQEIFKAGDASDALYILIKGELEVRSNDNILSTIYENGVVGEMGVFTHINRTASVKVVKDSLLYRTPADKIHELMEKESLIGMKLYRNVTKVLSEHLQRSNLVLEFYDINRA